MLRHSAILATAVMSALASAQGLVVFASAWPDTRPAASFEARTSDLAAPEGTPAQVSKAADGHYWAEANVEGSRVRFLVDTGASVVTLTEADARRLGIDVAELDFARPVITASGSTKAASITLDHVSVGGARVEDVQALVVREGLRTSLLGMSYLGRLSRFEATPTALVLRP